MRSVFSVLPRASGVRVIKGTSFFHLYLYTSIFCFAYFFLRMLYIMLRVSSPGLGPLGLGFVLAHVLSLANTANGSHNYNHNLRFSRPRHKI
jgi:hypothetical protein